MLKYLVIFAVVISLTIYVTVHDEQYADDSQHEPAQLYNPVSPTDTNEEQPQTCIEKTKGHPPSWHAFFAWPSGTGAWAIFLTLFAIVEQTTEVRKSADAAEKSIVLAQRPRIVVRNFYFTEIQSGPRTIIGIQEGSVAQGQFYIANTGGTDATLDEIVCEPFIGGQVLPMKRLYEGKIGTKMKLAMRPGTSITWQFALKEAERIGAVEHKNLLGSATRFFHVCGWIGYRDALGIYRKTHFCRRYVTVDGERFEAVSNPDYEYAD